MSRTNVDDLPLPDVPIPAEHFWGEWRDSFHAAPSPLPPDAYMKTPRPTHYDPNQPKAPHPNICVYYGAVRQGDFLTALCLRRYTSTLTDLIEHGTAFDAAKVFEGISAGVKHLHSLGLVHNDLNPENIMFGEDGVPVLVDFDSCGKAGEPMALKGGTPGWERPWPVSTIMEERDIYALSLLDKFMHGEWSMEEV